MRDAAVHKKENDPLRLRRKVRLLRGKRVGRVRRRGCRQEIGQAQVSESACGSAQGAAPGDGLFFAAEVLKKWIHGSVVVQSK